MKHVTRKELNQFQVRFPKSLVLQKKIAQMLSTVDQAIEQTKAIIAKQKRIKTGLMQDLLTKGIDDQGKIRSEATHSFQDSPLGRIPQEWEVVTLEFLLSNIDHNMRSGPFGSMLKKDELVDAGIPFLGIDNVLREKFVADFKRFVTLEKFEQLKQYRVREKDIMITIMGTVGRACVVPLGIGEALSSKHIWTMTFDQSNYIPELLCYQLNYSNWILSSFARESQGGIMEAINSKILRKLNFPHPPIEEQKQMNQLLQVNNQKITSLTQKLGKYQSLKKGLMQDLLTGKVSVADLDLDQALQES